MGNNLHLFDKYLIFRNEQKDFPTYFLKLSVFMAKKNPPLFKVEDFHTAKSSAVFPIQIYFSGLTIKICLFFKFLNSSKGIKSACDRVTGRIAGIAPAQ